MCKPHSTEVLRKPPHQESTTEMVQEETDVNKWTKNPETVPGNLV